MVMLRENEKKRLNQIRDALSGLHELVMRRVSPNDDCDPKHYAEVSETLVYQFLDNFGVEATIDAIKSWLACINRDGGNHIEELINFLQELRKL